MDRLDAIAVFVAVAECAGFALAARKLGRTPAAVSRAIADLEESLSVQLFNRTTRSVALTEEGKKYLVRARVLLTAHLEFEGGAPEGSHPAGKLKITAPANFGRHHLMPLVNQFLARYPKIDAQVLLLDRVVSLVEEGMDIGIRIGQPRDTLLHYTWVGDVDLGLYASPRYVERHGLPSAASELLEHSTIASGTFNPVPDRWPVNGKDGTNYINVKPRLVMSSTEAAAATAAAGLGITSLLSYQAAPFLRTGELVEILPDYTIKKIPINIVRPANRYAAPKVQTFIKDIGDALRSQFG